MKTLICLMCKCNFESKTTLKKYCSQICKTQFIKNQRLNDLSLIKKSICVFCQKEFKYVFRKDRNERIFCSRSCASKFYIQNGTFDKWRLRKNDFVDRFVKNCVICDKEIELTQCQIIAHEKFNMKFCCSKKCRILYTTLLFKGKPGPEFTKEMHDKQLKTLYKNHGVTNAFMLAKRRTITKPQRHICDWLIENYPEYEFKIEKQIINNEKIFFADIVSFKHKLIIEFYGDFWHCNPTKYNDDYVHPVKLLTAKEIQENDLKRINELQNANFNVNIIWEIDYNLNNWKDKIREWIKIYEEKNISIK